MFHRSEARNGLSDIMVAALYVLAASAFAPTSRADGDTLSIDVSPDADYLVIDGEMKDVRAIEEPERSKTVARFRQATSEAGWGENQGCGAVLAFDVQFGSVNRVVGGSCELSNGEKSSRHIAICLDDTGRLSLSDRVDPIPEKQLVEFMARECAVPEIEISAEGDVMWSDEIAWNVQVLADDAFREELASLRAYVAGEPNGAALQNCEMILMIPAKGGATSGYAGGLCGLAKDNVIERVAICANEMVGYIKLRSLGYKTMTRRDLAAYVAYYCTSS